MNITDLLGAGSFVGKKDLAFQLEKNFNQFVIPYEL